MIVGLVGWINQALVKQQWNEFTVIRPYMQAHIRPHVLSAEAERALKPQASFRECAKDCPEMIVVPDGSFMMGSPPTEKGHNDGEGPQQQITFAKPFAVSRFPVTFADWDACSTVGGCPPITDSGYGRGNKPIANVNWDEAKQYVAWLARVTGQPYRLPTDAEWEYAARAGTTTAYPWGDEIGKGNANCSGCGSKWDKKETSPVGSFKPNDWGLFDMHGNVFHWVQDCHAESLDKIPADGSAAAEAEACRRGVRGGSWDMDPVMLRSANRGGNTTNAKYFDLSFRIARTIAP